MSLNDWRAGLAALACAALVSFGALDNENLLYVAISKGTLGFSWVVRIAILGPRLPKSVSDPA